MSGDAGGHGEAQRVMVTGASRGIGRATALAFADGGHRLGLLGRPSADLAEVGDACRDRGAEVVVGHADVTNAAEVEAAATAIIGSLDGLDVLVNNAGTGTYLPFLELSIEDWEHMFAVNVFGAANVIRAVVPTMLAQHAGHIVNIGSIRGIETTPKTAAYSASKFALVGMTKVLRQELEGTGVRVSVLAPGGVRTDFGQVPAATKAAHWLEPEVVAEAVVDMVRYGRRAWLRDVTIMQIE